MLTGMCIKRVNFTGLKMNGLSAGTHEPVRNNGGVRKPVSDCSRNWDKSTAFAIRIPSLKNVYGNVSTGRISCVVFDSSEPGIWCRHYCKT